MASWLSAFAIFMVALADGRSLSPLYGTNAGVEFNDVNTSYSIQALAAVRLHYGWVIDGIQGQYSNGKSLVWMPFHGTKTQFTEIHVAYPNERFVAATGKYGPYSSEQQQGVTVTELSFVSYNSITGQSITYGPYGGHETKNQTSFQTANGSEIVGVYGFTSDYMRGIGFVFKN